MSCAEFEVIQGDDWKIETTAKRADGTVISLVGVNEIEFSASPMDDPDNPVFTKTLGAGITVTNAAGGIFETVVARADTENLLGRYRIRAFVIDSADKKISLRAEELGIPTFIVKED